jgi:hypothetical protein
LEVVPIESLSPFLSLFCCSHYDRAAVRRVPAAVPAASDSGHLRHSLPQVRISMNFPSSSPSVLHLVRALGRPTAGDQNARSPPCVSCANQDGGRI